MSVSVEAWALTLGQALAPDLGERGQLRRSGSGQKMLSSQLTQRSSLEDMVTLRSQGDSPGHAEGAEPTQGPWAAKTEVFS